MSPVADARVGHHRTTPGTARAAVSDHAESSRICARAPGLPPCQREQRALSARLSWQSGTSGCYVGRRGSRLSAFHLLLRDSPVTSALDVPLVTDFP